MRKGLAIVLVAVLLVFTASGCGILQKVTDIAGDIITENPGPDDVGEDPGEDPGGDPGDDPEEDPGDDPGDDSGEDSDEDTDDVSGDSLFEGDIFYPWLAEDVLDSFQEFGYVWTLVFDNGTTNESLLYYKVEGQEELDGVSTERIKATITEWDGNREYLFWFDEDWNCLKAMSNNEAVDVVIADQLFVNIDNYVCLAGLASEVIYEDATYDAEGYNLVAQRSRSYDLADGGVTLHEFEFVDVFETKARTYGIADIGGEMVYLVIKDQWVGSTEFEEMLVTHAVRR